MQFNSACIKRSKNDIDHIDELYFESTAVSLTLVVMQPFIERIFAGKIYSINISCQSYIENDVADQALREMRSG